MPSLTALQLLFVCAAIFFIGQVVSLLIKWKYALGKRQCHLGFRKHLEFIRRVKKLNFEAGNGVEQERARAMLTHLADVQMFGFQYNDVKEFYHTWKGWTPLSDITTELEENYGKTK